MDGNILILKRILMSLKKFKEFLNEYTVNKPLFFYNNFKVVFAQKDDGSHSLESRLDRADISIQELEKDIKRSFKKIKKSVKINPEQRKIFLLVFNKYQLIVVYYKKGKNKYIQIATILTKNMIPKGYDEKYLIEFFDVNTGDDFTIIEGIGCEIIIERFDENYEILLNNMKVLMVD